MTKVLIPARGGSKKVDKKNLRVINGKPLLFYTINEALKFTNKENIFLSSDSQEILNYGDSFNIKLIERPSEISQDNSTSSDVILHFIEHLGEDNNYDIIYLQPTSPLRKINHIKSAFNDYNSNNCNSLISVSASKEFPHKSLILNQNRLEKFLKDEIETEIRQELPETFYPNGAIYIFNKKNFIRYNKIPDNNVFPFIMNENESLDIDSINELRIAEFLLQQNLK